MSFWSDLISSPQQLGTSNLTFCFLKQLGPFFCLHSDVKLVADIDDTELSQPLTATPTVATVYRKKIQTIAMSCFDIHVRYTDVLKIYHMSFPVQYSVSIYMWDILMLWAVSRVTPCTVSNCHVSRPHTTTLSITMLSDSHVPYNLYIITTNNVYISCKINSYLLSTDVFCPLLRSPSARIVQET